MTKGTWFALADDLTFRRVMQYTPLEVFNAFAVAGEKKLTESPLPVFMPNADGEHMLLPTEGRDRDMESQDVAAAIQIITAFWADEGELAIEMIGENTSPWQLVAAFSTITNALLIAISQHLEPGDSVEAFLQAMALDALTQMEESDEQQSSPDESEVAGGLPGPVPGESPDPSGHAAWPHPAAGD